MLKLSEFPVLEIWIYHRRPLIWCNSSGGSEPLRSGLQSYREGTVLFDFIGY